jgi:uncharacterized protein with HEPN domain
MSRDEAAISDILHAAALAAQFRGGEDKGEFLADAKTQAAVLHELLVIGEAAKRLSESFRRDHPEVPVRAIAGMRDKLIHAYDAVDMHEVWRTLVADLPALVEAMKKISQAGEDALER